MLAYIKIIRPLNVVITFLVVVVAILISEKENTGVIIILSASLAASLTAAAGNIINDIFDIETDKISHPDRVLVSGGLPKNEAWYAYLLLNLFAVIIASTLPSPILLLVIISVILLYVYSAYLKKMILIGNIIIAGLTGLAFIYGGVVTNNPSSAIIPALFAFLINHIREMVKDIQDVEGDVKSNIITFPIKYGFDKSKNLILIITILLIVSTFYPFIIKYYKIEYFILVMVIVNPCLVFCLKLMQNKKITIVSQLLKFNMIIGLVAIYLGR
jgi:4-hydroxybenzoate polyprenyltransferase